MSISLLIGDCREKLRELPDQSVHCCVTSPPYFGLRDYGTAQWDGGDGECDHRQLLGGNGAASAKQTTSAGTQGYQYRDTCGKCGATRIDRQMGLEPTPDEFVSCMVEVFREVRRVLRDDATLWLNIGDSYNAGRDGGHAGGGKQASLARHAGIIRSGANVPGMKPKDLIGIPWLLAFALRADGWFLRQDIIWSKPNPMPESVRDRCTKAHEYLFLLSKSPRYFYDAEAIAEPVAVSSIARWSQDIEGQAGSDRVLGKTNGAMKAVGRKNVSPGKIMAAEPIKGESTFGFGETRNKRSVWEVATQPFSEAHFATYPPALIEPCILAGCPERCCAKCGAPWDRQVERSPMVLDRSERTHEKGRTRSSGTMIEPPTSKTLGFAPSCTCHDGVSGGTVLDPFGGAGTTGLVADRLGRNAILIELNPEYAAIAEKRLNADSPLFAEVKAA